MAEDWRRRVANLDALEEKLKRELDDARQRYDRASKELENATAQAHELGLSTVAGANILRLVTKRFAVATSPYRDAVQRFCDFILHGKIPQNRRGGEKNADPPCWGE